MHHIFAFFLSHDKARVTRKRTGTAGAWPTWLGKLWRSTNIGYSTSAHFSQKSKYKSKLHEKTDGWDLTSSATKYVFLPFFSFITRPPATLTTLNLWNANIRPCCISLTGSTDVPVFVLIFSSSNPFYPHFFNLPEWKTNLLLYILKAWERGG